jgi:hypothetical protein
MLHRNHMLVLGAGLFATLAACHQAKPAVSVTTTSYEAEPPGADRAAGQDRSAREVLGYARSATQPPRAQLTRSPAPSPAPASAPEDDPMRQFDMP